MWENDIFCKPVRQTLERTQDPVFGDRTGEK